MRNISAKSKKKRKTDSIGEQSIFICSNLAQTTCVRFNRSLNTNIHSNLEIEQLNTSHKNSIIFKKNFEKNIKTFTFYLRRYRALIEKNFV